MSLTVGFNEERVHELYPEASMIAAEKVWSLPANKKDQLEKFANSGDYLGSLKLDGYFYMINITANHMYLFSRSKGVNGMLTEKMGHIPHIQAGIMEDMPADTLICGELYVPRGTSKDVTKIMGCKAPKAIERQAAGDPLCYYMNDIIMYNGEDLRDMPFEERLKVLEHVYDAHTCSPYITMAYNSDTNVFEKAMQALADGEEGYVLKRKDAKWVSGSRTAWKSIKVKAEDTIDAVIVGFGQPTKEYKGTSLESWEYWVPVDPAGPLPKTQDDMIPVTKAWYYGWRNSIEVAAYNEVGELETIGIVSSGLTDKLREAFALHGEDYLGKTVEIRCMSVDKKEHTLRHAFFKQFRPDKNPEECLIKDIFK